MKISHFDIDIGTPPTSSGALTTSIDLLECFKEPEPAVWLENLGHVSLLQHLEASVRIRFVLDFVSFRLTWILFEMSQRDDATIPLLRIL
jgi:hypothetical protein